MKKFYKLSTGLLLTILLIQVPLVSAELYKSKFYGFTFDYPSDWHVYDDEIAVGDRILAAAITSSPISSWNELSLHETHYKVSIIHQKNFPAIDTSQFQTQYSDERSLWCEEASVSVDGFTCKNLRDLVMFLFDDGSFNASYVYTKTADGREFDVAVIDKFVKGDFRIFRMIGMQDIDRDSIPVSPIDSFQYVGVDEGGGCLIATATYGSELAPQVQQLRELRDNKLLNTESGANFMKSFNDVYYSFSPIIADYERENPLFKEMIKLAITPMITSLSILNYVDMDSEAEVLGYGISLILLNVGMYFVAPAIVIMRIRK